MPRIARRSLTEDFEALHADSRAHNETNDCAVKAVAAACNVPYADAHRVMKNLGRQDRRGTQLHITMRACQHFGFKMVARFAEEFISQYPKSHQILKSVTTHHPDRFAKVWADGKTYMFRTQGHILTIKNGRNCDWTRGRAMRCIDIYEVVPAATVTKADLLASLTELTIAAERHPEVKMFAIGSKYSKLCGDEQFITSAAAFYLINEISAQITAEDPLYKLCQEAARIAKELYNV